MGIYSKVAMDIRVLASIAEADCFNLYDCTNYKENDAIFQSMEKDHLHYADGKAVIAIDTGFMTSGEFFQLSISDIFSDAAMDLINEVSSMELAKEDEFQKYNTSKWLDSYFYEDPRALQWDDDV